MPDLSDGSVVVLNDRGDQVGTPIPVAQASAPLTVNVQNGALFINDPDSDTAYSVAASGQVNLIAKNAPNVPTNHATTTPSTAPPAPPPPVLTPTPATPKPGSGPNVPTTAPTSVPTPTIPASVPAAPGAPTALAGNGSATVSWTPPDTHGSPITGYTVTWTAGGGGSKPASADVTSVPVTGLKNGTSYTFSIKASNAIGTGPAAQTTSVTPTSTIPNAPHM